MTANYNNLLEISAGKFWQFPFMPTVLRIINLLLLACFVSLMHTMNLKISWMIAW